MVAARMRYDKAVLLVDADGVDEHDDRVDEDLDPQRELVERSILVAVVLDHLGDGHQQLDLLECAHTHHVGVNGPIFTPRELSLRTLVTRSAKLRKWSEASGELTASTMGLNNWIASLQYSRMALDNRSPVTLSIE
jgi:hypothetical protein